MSNKGLYTAVSIWCAVTFIVEEFYWYPALKTLLHTAYANAQEPYSVLFAIVFFSFPVLLLLVLSFGLTLYGVVGGFKLYKEGQSTLYHSVITLLAALPLLNSLLSILGLIG